MDRWKAEQGRGREKRKIRREKSRKRKSQKKQMRERVGKSRNTCTVFFQWFVAPEGRKVGSLKRRVRSQLARWEINNCTALWREARFQVKMHKTHHGRTTFGSWAVEKVHAIVARSTFRSQHVKSTRGWDHFWRKTPPDIFLLQETHFTQDDVSRFSARANACGYRFWHTVPEIKNGQVRGGVAIGVKCTLPAVHTQSYTGTDGQALTVQVSATVLASVWRSPTAAEHIDWINHLSDTMVTAQAMHQTFLFGGDWNWTPEENMFWHNDFNLAAVMEHGSTAYLPTRWKGTRCLDYFISHPDIHLDLPSFWEDVFGDHKALQVTAHVHSAQHNVHRWLPTRNFDCPTSIPSTEWAQTLANLWNQLDTNPPFLHQPVNVEQEWDWFNYLLENLFLRAFESHHLPAPKAGRTKGSIPHTIEGTDDRGRGAFLGTYATRKLRNILGRLREAKRQRSKGNFSSHVEQKLWRTWPPDWPWHNWDQAEVFVHHKLEVSITAQRTAILRTWRANMARQGKQATNWLKGHRKRAPPTVFDDSGVASSPHQSLTKIFEFWEKNWNRSLPTPEISTLEQELANSNHRHPLPQVDWIATPEHMAQRARFLRASSSGPDGWTGNSISYLPLECFGLFKLLVHRWSSVGTWPKAWQHLRQVHLPKEEPDAANRLHSKNMRPISILSVWYRLLVSCFLHQVEVQEWISQIAPSSCHGAIPGKSIATALAALTQSLERGHVVCSLDYTKCFDYVRPALALKHFELHAWPPAFVSLISHVWTKQNRHLQLGPHMFSGEVSISTSLPQGDPLSPLALILVLANAVQDIQGTITQAVFLDDRALAGEPATIHRAILKWSSWSKRLGLLENQAKTAFFAPSMHQRFALMKLGYRADQIHDQIRFLGIDLVAPNAGEPLTGQQRWQEAKAMASRLIRMPMPWNVRRQLFRTRIIPKCSWGRFVTPMPAKWNTQLVTLYRTVAGVQGMASRHLAQLLDGHNFCPSFEALAGCLRHLKAVVQLLAWPADGCNLSWVWNLDSQLKTLSWNNTAPWTWQHPVVGTFVLTCDPGDHILHQLRHSWRVHQWNEFLNHQRRDARSLAQFAFDHNRYDKTRKLFCIATQSERAVFLGAANSLATYQVMYEGDVTGKCSLCGCDVVPSWDHLAWHCSFFSTDRPTWDMDGVCKRLGWPMDHWSQDQGRRLIAFMARVRETVRTFAPKGTVVPS